MSSDLVRLTLYLVLAVVAYIDQRTYRIPNGAIVSIVALAVVNVINGGAVHLISALGLASALSFLPLILGYILGRAVYFGAGDVKLMGACALFIDPEDLGNFVMGIGLLSILHRLIFRKTPIPFAPAIAASFMLMTTFGPSIRR
jgi:Flp pilus assembly protein protease CpaA